MGSCVGIKIKLRVRFAGRNFMVLFLLSNIFFLLFLLEIFPPSNVLAVVTDKILGILAHDFLFYRCAF
ncbi:MAG TPA: hypothetical protein DC050_16695 [Pseudomonas sp.]|nr:hypothetical protein [Pseudomonas sp.]